MGDTRTKTIFHDGAAICRKYRSFSFVCINFRQMFERSSSYSFRMSWPGRLNPLKRRASVWLLKWVHRLSVFDSTRHFFFGQVFTPFRLWKSLSHRPSLSRVSLPLFESVFSYYFMCYLLWQTLPDAVTFPPFSEVIVISDEESVSIFFASYVCARTFPAQKVPSLWEKRSRLFRISVSIVSHC